MVQPSAIVHHSTVHQNNTIHLMVQQPTVLFGYWEVSSRLRALIERHYRSSWDALRKIARLYQYDYSEVETEPLSYRDIEVGGSENWYFRHIEPRHRYVLDYGFLNHDNQFVSLLRSAAVGTPRNSPDELPTLAGEASPINHDHTHSQLVVQGNLQTNHSPFQQFSTYTLYSDH